MYIQAAAGRGTVETGPSSPTALNSNENAETGALVPAGEPSSTTKKRIPVPTSSEMPSVGSNRLSSSKKIVNVGGMRVTPEKKVCSFVE